MNYGGPLLAVKDINHARKFYEELLGLTVISDYGINIAFSCGLALQQDFDWLLSIPKEDIAHKPNNFEIYFEEDNFDGFVLKLKDMPDIDLLHDVREHGWGQRVIRFYDPDGHIIEVAEKLKAVVNRFLAEGMSMQQTSERMDVSLQDLEAILARE